MKIALYFVVITLLANLAFSHAILNETDESLDILRGATCTQKVYDRQPNRAPT